MSSTDNRTKRVRPIYMRAPDGKRHRVHYIPNYSGMGAHAWVWSRLGKKKHQYAAGEHVIDNLIRRLKSEGWEEDF